MRARAAAAAASTQRDRRRRHEQGPEHARATTRDGCSTIGTETIVTTSAIVTCAITVSTARPSEPALLERGQQHGGRAGGEHDRVDRGVPVAGDRAPRAAPPGPPAAPPAPPAARPRAARRARRASRSGRCMPTVSISIAKPTSARNEIVGSVGSTTPSTSGPTRMPARISPTTTGTKLRPSSPSSGPPRPASTITTASEAECPPQLTSRPGRAARRPTPRPRPRAARRRASRAPRRPVSGWAGTRPTCSKGESSRSQRGAPSDRARAAATRSDGHHARNATAVLARGSERVRERRDRRGTGSQQGRQLSARFEHRRQARCRRAGPRRPPRRAGRRRATAPSTPPSASTRRPASHRERDTGSASIVSSRSSASSWRAAATCAQANRLTASTKNRKLRPMYPAGG